ncbi:MAG: asparagine synthetase B family protein, partial [Aggregatilineales bacterium]
TPMFDPMPALVKKYGYAVADKLVQARRPKAALYALTQPDEAARMASWIPLFNFEQKSALLTSTAQNAMQDYDVTQAIQKLLSDTNAKHPLNRMLYVDTHLWLPDYLLSRGDKLTMAVSLEGRVPLLDYKLVEFAARLPTQMKMNGTARKYLLKQLSYKWLPAENIDRKKKGFPVPVPLWLRDELREFVRDILTPERIKERGLFNVEYVERLLNEHEAETADHATMIYGLLNLELWQQQFLDGIGRPAGATSPVQVA